jgi:predicted DNA-binding transcriptional regulator AlpA
MDNPFEEIISKLNLLEKKLSERSSAEPAAEIIDRRELQRRLGISEPTVISMVKKKKIPQINLGSSVRYNWNKVLDSLNKK